jgi:hypothetical protein
MGIHRQAATLVEQGSVQNAQIRCHTWRQRAFPVIGMVLPGARRGVRAQRLLNADLLCRAGYVA